LDLLDKIGNPSGQQGARAPQGEWERVFSQLFPSQATGMYGLMNSLIAFAAEQKVMSLLDTYQFREEVIDSLRAQKEYDGIEILGMTVTVSFWNNIVQTQKRAC